MNVEGVAISREDKALKRSLEMGIKPIGSLLASLSIPATIGQMVMVLYAVVDTYFVAQYVGVVAVGGVSIVAPINMLVSAIGLSVGIGGGSMIVRFLGAREYKKANKVFGTMFSFTLISTLLLSLCGYLFIDPLMMIFGAHGNLLPVAKEFYSIVMIGAPFLALTMMMNHSMRNEGRAIVPMIALSASTMLNMILDYVFIVVFKWGLAGAAWATVISQVLGFLFLVAVYLSGSTTVKIKFRYFLIRTQILKETISQSIAPYIRMSSINIVTLCLNQALYMYGGDLGVAANGIIGRIIMFSTFILIGLAQGAMPLMGYNYGAGLYHRVQKTYSLAFKIAFIISFVMMVMVEINAGVFIRIFTDNEDLIAIATPGLRIMMVTVPLMSLQNIGAFYFQAIGKPMKSITLTMARQVFLLIPLPVMMLMPNVMSLDVIWWAFPFADVAATIITVVVMLPAWRLLDDMRRETTL